MTQIRKSPSSRKMDERFDKHFMKVETLMAFNMKKKSPITLIIREMQINHRDNMFHLPDLKNFKQYFG